MKGERERERERQTDRQTDRETDRQTDSQSVSQTDRDRENVCVCVYVCVRACVRACVCVRACNNLPCLIVLIIEDVPLVEFMYLVFTRIPGDSYCRRLRSLLLYFCYVSSFER